MCIIRIYSGSLFLELQTVGYYVTILHENHKKLHFFDVISLHF